MHPRDFGLAHELFLFVTFDVIPHNLQCSSLSNNSVHSMSMVVSCNASK